MSSTSSSTGNGGSHYNPQVLHGKGSLQDSLHRLIDGLRKEKGAMAAAGIAVVILAVGVTIYANRREAGIEAGKNALFDAQKAYETEMKALAGVKAPQPASAAPAEAKDAKAKEAEAKAKREEEMAAAKRLDDLAFQKLDVDSKLPETVRKYKDVIAKHGGTRPAFEARMALGDLYFRHGNAAQATPLYQEAVDSAPGNLEKALALSSLGYSLENAGKPAEAIPVFERALNLGEGGIKGDVLLAIARCHEALHDTAKARSTYDQILSQLPNTDASKTAELLKSRLQ